MGSLRRANARRWLLAFGAGCLGCGGSEFLVGTAPGGGGDGGPGDASTLADATSSGDGTAPDAGADGGGGGGDSSLPPDGSPPVDAGDGGAAKFSCANFTGVEVLFCSDFDEGTASPWGWQNDPTFNGGTNALDTATFLSAPAAYAATTPTLLTGGAAFASLGKDVQSSASNLSFAFQMNVKQFDVAGKASVRVARLAIGPITSSYEDFDLVLDSKGLHLVQMVQAADGGTQVQENLLPVSIGTNVWFRVEMKLNRGASPWTLTVLLDNVQQLVTQTLTTPSNTDVEVGVGILDVLPPSGPNAVDFDNVLLRGTL